VTTDLTALARDAAAATSVKRETFYATGMELIETGECPFCDTQWDVGELKKLVQEKLNHLEDVSEKRTAAEKKIAPLIANLRKVQATVNTLTGYAALTTPPVNVEAVRKYSTGCGAAVDRLTALLPLGDTIAVLAKVPTVPQPVVDAIGEVEKAVRALPEPTKQDAAREWLIVAQERLDVWRDAVRKQKAANERAQRARQVSDIYASTSDKVLVGVYTAVENELASPYGFINRDDEDKFKAQLVPSMGKLGFDVDFYGRGFFPPGAYHSEGHQDSMGLCLYLALMRYLQGSDFTFAVLDDVLMSVDVGHRREVSTLLKKEFPNTQFIMTTHDPIWLRHMRTEGLIEGRAAVQFRSWSVDHGPTQWDDRDVWSEIDDHLNRNDVRAAASLLRHYLEYTSAELCHRLRAPVEFRGDARYQLGELLPPAVSRMRKFLNSAKVAASSWDQRDIVEQIASRESAFTASVAASNVEQWQVNIAVHYNSWDNLGKEDFEPVVKAFQNLLDGFTCTTCKEYVRISLDREIPEALRCDCGRTTFNLRKKGA
jgi:hypothetical protein